MKVSIVDDEQVSIFIIQQKLILEGMVGEKDVHGFLSSKKALEFFFKCRQEELPDVILLDLSMPEIDGWQFLDALEPVKSKIKERCRIYILTTSLSALDEANAKKHSMVTGFFQKPVSTENLRKVISQVDTDLNLLI